MIDEVALEERAVHFRHTNSVGGLCWRHSRLGDLVLQSSLIKKIKAGHLHFAKEMTVVAASLFGESGTYPILALPTFSDDPLERLFGKLRMLGGHNSAMNYAQAIDRLGHACDLQGAFLCNPNLEQDHLTMKSWTNDLTAGSCHMAGAWATGREVAVGILKKSSVLLEHYSYKTLFLDPDVDMLRPFRGEKYPGVESDDDRSMIITVTTTTTTTTAPPSPEPEPTDSEDEDEGDGMSFEESIPADVAPELEPPAGPGITPEDYLHVNGKWFHKQRICRLIISKDFEPKSTVRLLRVPGYRNVNIKPRDDTNIDPAYRLLCFAPPQLTRTAFRSSILAPTIQNPAVKVKITGQIYALTLARKTAASDVIGPSMTSPFIRTDDWLESEEESEWAWIWNGKYSKVDSAIRGTSSGDAADKVVTDKVVLVSVPGILTELVNPTTIDASIRFGAEVARQINSLGTSWEIDDKQIGLVCELLWGRAVENKITPAAITATKKNGPLSVRLRQWKSRTPFSNSNTAIDARWFTTFQLSPIPHPLQMSAPLSWSD
ncbi:hypothetical protein MVEN_00068200 [Mycena venus]|uniref:Uncharacterized protein n=1 Tax=Mycena venus TaxID=2733690 RepID=A0A8H6Z989_9AGAR|nr:hypothetical protein MVEN_00068200 [Mycena venus]